MRYNRVVLEVLDYNTPSGKDVFNEWLIALKDARAQARVVDAIERLAQGNRGDSKWLRDGVSELRIHYGPGYRIYYSIVGQTVLLLLCGGDKRRQVSDIRRAIGFLRDFERRSEK